MALPPDESEKIVRNAVRVIALTTAVVAIVIGAGASPAVSAEPPDTRGFTATPLEPDGAPVDVAKSVSGQLAESDPDLLARSDDEVVTVMAKVDVDAAASYAGDVKGFAATSPQITGKTLSPTDPTVARYLRHVSAETATASEEIAAALPAAEVTAEFTVAYGGLAVRLPANQAKDLLDIPGVVAVQTDAVATMQTDETPTFIGATKVWPSLGGSNRAGQGVIVGVIDSGIWPEHDSFKDPGVPRPPGGPWRCDFTEKYSGTAVVPGVAGCNDKLIGAYAFLATNVAVNGDLAGDFCTGTVCSARDSNGHGTHTASTAAGSPVSHATLLGVDRGRISGIAPGASVIAYRVCRPGCYQSDTVAAVQQAILDGVDVINFSVSGGNNAYSDPVELAFLDAYGAGISVNASAGNAGPGAGTADHAGPWVTTVAASTSDRFFESQLTLTAPGGETYSKVGSTVTQGVSGAPVVLAQNVPGYGGGALCSTPLAAGSVTGKVVLCQRGGNARVDKGYNALQGGAVGMILYNPTLADTQTDNHWLPTVHLDGPNDDLVAFVTAHPDATATWAPGQKSQVQGDVMAGFSSRGPLGDFLKPDVTAPGVQILAGASPVPAPDPAAKTLPGQFYQAIAGTSMSSPHAAGTAALVKASHPDWTPGQIKSALMTSSVQSVTDTDRVTPADPFDRGAGSIRANRAVKAPLTFDVTAAEYSAMAADPVNRVDLNLPSISANPLPGALTTTRIARNSTSGTHTYNAKASGASGLKVTVAPKTFTLAPGATQELTIVIDGTNTADGSFSFGQITIKASGGVATVLPVVAKRGPSSIGLTHMCDPTALERRQVAQCEATVTNQTSVAADATVTVTAPAKVEIGDVKAPAVPTANGLQWSGTLSPALPPTVDSIAQGVGPGGGYLPLSAFGITPIAGVGDESVVNFNTPAFKYGEEVYTRLGIDSNGYVVVGGADAGDNNCCNAVEFPNSARPNNTLAPFWTDLDPSKAVAVGGAPGGVRIGTLTDGVDTWIIVDFAGIPTYSSATGLVQNFEIWLRTGATEGVTFSYGDLQGPDPTTPAAFGAENRVGTSGANIPAASVVSGSEFLVETSGPTPGGSVTLSYEAASRRVGTYDLLATLTSPSLKGSATQKVTLTVQ